MASLVVVVICKWELGVVETCILVRDGMASLVVVVICKRELGVVVTCTLELVVVETYKLVWDDMVLVEDGMASWVVVVTCTLGYVVGSVVLWVVVVTCKLGCVEGSVGPWVVVVICKQELEVVETCKRGDDGVEEETYKLGYVEGSVAS